MKPKDDCTMIKCQNICSLANWTVDIPAIDISPLVKLRSCADSYTYMYKKVLIKCMHKIWLDLITAIK